MGSLTVERLDNLYWLGRYVERVYQSVINFSIIYDKMIDGDEAYYKTFCEQFALDRTYNSKEEFIKDFYNPQNPHSVVANMTRAYDNAMVMRDEISSAALSYIHLAQSVAGKCSASDSPVYELQRLEDYILAFWGSLDDQVEDEITRSAVKVGKRIERLDLYLRFKRPKAEIQREVRRLMHRVERTELEYDRCALMYTAAMAEEEIIDYDALIMKEMQIFTL